MTGNMSKMQKLQMDMDSPYYFKTNNMTALGDMKKVDTQVLLP